MVSSLLVGWCSSFSLVRPGKHLGQRTRFEAVMAVLLKIPHFWEMTPCGSYIGTRVLVELAAFILRLVQGGLLHCRLGVLRKWRKQAPPKRSNVDTYRHDFTFHRLELNVDGGLM